MASERTARPRALGADDRAWFARRLMQRKQQRHEVLHSCVEVSAKFGAYERFDALPICRAG